MSLEGVLHLAVVGVPYLGCFIEGTSDNQISKWIIEGHSINDVFVLLERQQLVTCLGIPDLACPIIRSCNEFVTRLVESTIGEGQKMGSKLFEQFEFLFLIFHLLFD